MRTLFHFTAAQFIDRIRKEGITKCVIPFGFEPDGRVKLRRGYQWLTREQSFEQPWAQVGTLPLTKNAWRITVEIPAVFSNQLARWDELCVRYPIACADDLNMIPGHGDWYLYRGEIPPEWFGAITRNHEGRINPFDLMEGVDGQ